MTPSKISLKDEKFLHIKWSDNTESDIKLANLRMACPCALCAAEREEKGAKYIPLYNKDEIIPEAINVVGNYAVTISWADKHNTGIYLFDYLKKLADSN